MGLDLKNESTLTLKMDPSTDLWATRSTADDKHLCMSCDVVIMGHYSSNYNMLIADLFGISPVDELGYARLFGKIDQIIGEGIMWFAHISNFADCDYYLRSNYNITRWDDLIIIHPEELDAINRMIIFPPPRVWIDDSLGNTQAELAPGEHTVQTRDWFYVSLSRWSTKWC